jgi:clan AA aspartic protease
MIAGQVTSDGNEAVLLLDVEDWNGNTHEIRAIVDTGFDRYLTLPPKVIGPLGLSRRGSTRAVLADGSVRDIDTYGATVVWNGKKRNIEVQRAKTVPLVGMSLLSGCGLWIACEANGVVEVSELT